MSEDAKENPSPEAAPENKAPAAPNPADETAPEADKNADDA
jgi:hypothetical protein